MASKCICDEGTAHPSRGFVDGATNTFLPFLHWNVSDRLIVSSGAAGSWSSRAPTGTSSLSPTPSCVCLLSCRAGTTCRGGCRAHLQVSLCLSILRTCLSCREQVCPYSVCFRTGGSCELATCHTHLHTCAYTVVLIIPSKKWHKAVDCHCQKLIYSNLEQLYFCWISKSCV